MTNPQEFLSREAYEARYAKLAAEKQCALRKIVLARRDEIYVQLREIVTAQPFNVRPGDRADYFEYHPEISPELDPVLEFYLELGRIEGIVTGTRERFWPFEGNWKEVSESLSAAIPDTDTRNPVLAAVSDTYNPQILENDKMRVMSILQKVNAGTRSMELTRQEEDRLFHPLSGKGIGKQPYVPHFTVEQMLQKNAFVGDGVRTENGSRTFRIETPQELAEFAAQIRRMCYVSEDRDVYDVSIPSRAKSRGKKDVTFHIEVPRELAPLWESLFDRNTQKLLRARPEQGSYYHPLSQSHDGTMRIPVLRRGEERVPVMRKDAGVIAPTTYLFDAGSFHGHIFTQVELEQMKK